MSASISKLEELLSLAIAENSKVRSLPSEIVLYGAGSIGRECLLLLQSKGVVVRAVLDAKSALTKLEGVPVLHPQDPTFTETEKARIPLVISIFNAYISMVDIEVIVKAAGWQNITGYLNFHRQHSAALSDKYWLTNLAFYRKNPGWSEGIKLWKDEYSKQLYHDILKFRFTGSYMNAPLPQTGEQYFPETIPAWEKNLRFVDCGAYDGDTIELLAQCGYKLDALAAFEPDAEKPFDPQ